MLDFVKAMKIAERMCKEHQSGTPCTNCQLGSCESTLPGCCFFQFQGIKNWAEIERRLIEWDKAHPEPQYPTWEEWQKENFPDAHNRITPCAFRPCLGQCKGCDECRKQPIPADIAKKLGIQPINQQEA